MSSGRHALEAISVRRATVADADKVRYRVYTSPKEFIAVIAESALMAVKVSGIKTPYKIMRDLPTDGVAIEAKKMAHIDEQAERVALRLETEIDRGPRVTEMEVPPSEPAQPFVPVGLADLRSKGGNRARILPPEMVHQIIEEHAKAQSEEQHETVLIPERELSTAEKITMLANEVPLPNEAPAEPGKNEEGLSPEEVEQLLNGS